MRLTTNQLYKVETRLGRGGEIIKEYVMAVKRVYDGLYDMRFRPIGSERDINLTYEADKVRDYVLAGEWTIKPINNLPEDLFKI